MSKTNLFFKTCKYYQGKSGVLFFVIMKLGKIMQGVFK